ncbi:MAG TPA: cyclic nucleotide-binding domain-containing protein [Rubricoccaceae bacterium]|nr:cyclic nucleotide-binding domain-containing protein [Rubricoccaceae bacterium]
MRSLWKNVLGPREEGEAEDLLSRIPLFDTLDRRELAAVRRILHRREYVAGESIFVQGEPGLGMYIVVRGIVSIQSEPTGRVLIELGDGDFFGEIALLNEVIRSATARARTDCLLLSLFQPDLMSLLDRSPRIGVKVLLALARLVGMRLVQVSDELEEMRSEHERAQAQLAGAVSNTAGPAAEGASVTGPRGPRTDADAPPLG